MSPERLGGPAYRAVGGEVVGRDGRRLATPPLALFRFFGEQAIAHSAAGDRLAARHCALMACDLASAITQAGRWRRAGRLPAASAGPASPETRTEDRAGSLRNR